MNTPTWVNLPDIYKGIDYSYSMTLYTDDAGQTAKDLSGYSAEMVLRETKESDSTVVATFTVTIETPESDGTLTISLTDTETDAIDSSYTYGYYGLLLIDGSGISEPWLTGKIKIRTDFPTTES